MIKEAGVTAEQALQVIALAQTRGSNAEVLGQLGERFAGNEAAAKGVVQLGEMCHVLRTAGISRSTCGSTSPSAAGSTTTPAPYTKPSCPICPASAASVPAAATTT